MSFFSFHFLLFLCLLFVAYHRTRSRRVRRALLTAANLVFLLSLTQDGAVWLGLACFLLASFGMLVLMRMRPWRWWPGVFAAIAVLALVYLKQYEFLALVFPASLLNHAIELVGISYMTFKLIHMIVDLHQGQLDTFTFATYLNYQIGFFSLVAGPMQRYNDFYSFWEKLGDEFDGDASGLRHWSRVLTGLIKLGVLAAAAMYAYRVSQARFSSAGTPMSFVWFLLLLYTFPAYVYFNFSGYCDVVIGAAGLLGLRHQENFDRPYLARNLIDFWNRWHISLTMWIRDYVFMASYKWVAERWTVHAAKAGYLLAFISLFLAGVWHGSTWNFAVFGLVHGVGMAVTQIYGDVLAAALGRSGMKRYMANPWVRRAAVCATFHYACFSFLFFTPELGATVNLLRRFWGVV